MIIDSSNISKTFGKTDAVSNATFSVKEGEALVLLGPNGAGKSTILKLVAGLYKPTRGHLSVMGQEPYDASASFRKKISFLGENYALYDNITVRDNLRFFGTLHDIKKDELNKKIRFLLSSFGAEKYIDMKLGSLSRGTKQKIAVCRALINDPKVLVLDEPTAFLDPYASQMLHKEIAKRSKEGMTVMYATQKLEEIYNIGDRILIINNGKIQRYGTPEKIINGLKNIVIEVCFASQPSAKALEQLRHDFKISDVRSLAMKLEIRRMSEIQSVIEFMAKLGCKIVSVSYLKESIGEFFDGRKN